MFRNLLLVGVMVAAAMLAGCGGKGAGRAPCPAGKLCLEYGNTTEPVTLDPHKATGTWESRLLGDVFVGLTTDDADGAAMPGLATSWETSPDGLTWIFHLRDAVWSDGVPITADDFVFSLRRIMDPKTASEYASLLYFIAGAQPVNEGKAPPESLGVRAIDAHTLEIKLVHPAPYLPELAKHQTMFAVPKHAVEKYGDAWVRPENFVSSGPYVVKSWRLGDYVLVEKNPRFYDAAHVCFDQVRYYPTVDAVSAERRIKRGEIDVNTDMQSNRIAFLKKTMPGYIHVNTYLGVAYIAFNTSAKNGVPAFRDVRVRQALDMAVDRDFITGKLLRGGQLSAYTFTPPGLANYTSPKPPAWAAWSFERRQAEARRLLAAAGYGPGHPLKFTLKHRNTPDPMLFMPAVQADWKAIGVEAQLAQEETQIAYADYRARAFQAADASWVADYNDPMTFLYLMGTSTGAQNYSDYSNRAYDALLAKADAEPDAVRRAGYLAQAESMMLEEAPVIPIYFYVNKNMVNPRITGWRDNLVDWHRVRFLCAKP
ncbi:MAG: peptide transporter substrate-binding protein [Caulobacter sp.]|nr:peptide transporter substrate-binding protein [Caulobacter sp.]